MPRGRNTTRKQVNPQHQELLSKVLGSVYDVKKIENSKKEDWAKLMAFPEENNDMLEDIVADVVTTFQIDHNLRAVTQLINVKPVLDKRRLNTLPKYAENTVSRVVVVSGTHEIFEIAKMSILPFKQGVFVPQGQAFKTAPGQGDMTYDDRDMYDKTKYPGRGFKRPHERRLVVIDFVAADAEAAAAAVGSDTSKAGEKLVQDGGPGLIQNMLKLFGK